MYGSEKTRMKAKRHRYTSVKSLLMLNEDTSAKLVL